MRARFWRNVTLVAIVHAAALLALLRWSSETRAASAPEITWLSGAAEPDTGEAENSPLTSASTPEPTKITPATQSEIVLPSPTPIPTPAPAATPRPTPKKSSPKPTSTPKTKPKKSASPKPDATPARKKSEKATKEKSEAQKPDGPKSAAAGTTKKSAGGSGDGSNGTGSGKSDAATANHYGNMLHDRFYRAWQQPQTVVASGVKLSAVARIRIEKDGRVSDFKIVKPSGNVLMDESIQAAGKKVTQVDALPAGIGNSGHYDVNINFALNSQ
jgi:TonB family protein